MTDATPTLAADGALRALLARQSVLAVVRAPEIPDAAALCRALHDGGICVVELTFSTPKVEEHVARARAYAATHAQDGASSGQDGIVVGVGTVTRVDQARSAIDAGASFLVTPGMGQATGDIVGIAHDAGVPVMVGALTPSEVISATELGADVVKIFPASLGGPRLISDLRGPFPDVPLVPSGGVSADNAQAFLDAGAIAVCAGTGVVPPAAVAAADWALIRRAAGEFRSRLSTPAPAQPHSSTPSRTSTPSQTASPSRTASPQ